jgi:hypothetical protein
MWLIASRAWFGQLINARVLTHTVEDEHQGNTMPVVVGGI